MFDFTIRLERTEGRAEDLPLGPSPDFQSIWRRATIVLHLQPL